MNRRDFIKNFGMITGAGAVTMSISGIPVKAFARSFLNINSANGKILVLIQMKGGNDGLNMVVPLDQYSTYISKRPTIGHPENTILKLNNQTGIHPSLTGLQNLYSEGKFTVIQNVGYANPNRSHFRSTDIWLSASDSNQVLFDGWAGRYLLKAFPDFPAIPPQHPMAIQIGSVQSGVFDSTQGGLAISFDTPDSFYSLVNGITADTDIPPATLAGDELKFLKEVASLSVEYATVIKQKSDVKANKYTYPANSTFANQLKIIAGLIGGGLETPVYLATLDGFDTHSNEVLTQKKLMGYLGDAIYAFQKDLELMGVADKVVLFTFSEFGRRVAENASAGTDHGTAAPMLMIGKNVQGGVFGANASLTNLDSNGDLKYVIDYRQVYSTVLMDHFGMTAAQTRDILLRDFSKLSLITSVKDIDYIPGLPKDYSLAQNYPNPFNPSTKIEYTIREPADVKLKIYDSLGKEVETIVNSYQSAGTYTVNFNGGRLASGTYLYSLETENERIVKKMSLIK